jgi:hypothetical protein
MILGMSTPAFAQFHVIISLVGIFTGLVALFGLLSASRLPTWTALFLLTTIATSVTGFMFPSTGFMFPSAGFDAARVVGVLSLVVLAIALLALYSYHLVRAWRWVYVASSTIALYLNVFVGVVQAFQKVPFLHPLAPNGSELPFIIAQVLVMAIFLVLGILAVKRFHPVVRVLA